MQHDEESEEGDEIPPTESQEIPAESQEMPKVIITQAKQTKQIVIEKGRIMNQTSIRTAQSTTTLPLPPKSSPLKS
jgi:hypothetical protein